MIENFLERPGVAELFELGRGEGSLAGVFVQKKAQVAGKLIHEINFPKECIVAAIIREKHFIVPRGDTKITAEDHVLFVGLTQAIKKARAMFILEN